ncbi:MAG: hypothetical protein H6652_18595 [Ardenticatenaceae bacterium]|nr:hypothetical protein [Ardenticatenaceae bacterium]
MLLNLSGTITPWILGTLILLLLLALAVVFKSWREMKRSPYFFMRLQAEKRLQTYSFASLGLLAASALFAFYALRPPVDNTPLVAVLTNAKPVTEEVAALAVQERTAMEFTPETDVTSQIISTSNDPLFITNADSLVQAALELPEEYNRFEPRVDLNESTELGQISFSTKINDDYEAIDATNIFAVGSYTVYATFSYDGMADGMSWAWVWRHDGEVVDGGNEYWEYGDDGPGYIFYNPEEGFRAGEYTLEVWVNGELLTRSNMRMTGSALSSGN